MAPAIPPGNRLAVQDTLFDDAPEPASAAATSGSVRPCPPSHDVLALSQALRQEFAGRLHLGTSSWYFPGWAGLVWDGAYSQAQVVRHGLPAYAQHPLLGTVSLDRSFYRPLDATAYGALAAQVPASFRFMVKMFSAVTDATLREAGTGRTVRANPQFLDAAAAVELCAKPAAAGLGAKLGVLLLQLSPLPPTWLAPSQHDALLEALARLLRAVTPHLPADSTVALEVRDASLLTPAMAAMLKSCGARYCLGLHARMPGVDEQLPMLRATWPGPLVCRWNLQRGLAYQQAKNRFEPFNQLAAPDVATRQALARIVHATVQAGQPVFVAINNKAEGCAPLSVVELAREVVALGHPAGAQRGLPA